MGIVLVLAEQYVPHYVVLQFGLAHVLINPKLHSNKMHVILLIQNDIHQLSNPQGNQLKIQTLHLNLHCLNIIILSNIDYSLTTQLLSIHIIICIF